MSTYPTQPYLWSKASLVEGLVIKHCASYNGLIYPVVKFSHVDYSFTQSERECMISLDIS